MAYTAVEVQELCASILDKMPVLRYPRADLRNPKSSPTATEIYIQQEARKPPGDLLLGPNSPQNKDLPQGAFNDSPLFMQSLEAQSLQEGQQL